MYGPEDIRNAQRQLRRSTIILLSLPLVMLAAYVAAIVAGSQAAMLAALLMAFVWLVLAGDLIWLPAKRYAKFLREMESGLRRSVVCVPERLEDAVQMQDGVRVRALHVRLEESGDSRIYYINVSKLYGLPPMGTPVQLMSYGRHVIKCEAVKE